MPPLVSPFWRELNLLVFDKRLLFAPFKYGGSSVSPAFVGLGIDFDLLNMETRNFGVELKSETFN